MSADLTELYQQVILDHNRRPRNRGKLPTANRVAHGDNPTCGDEVHLHLRIADDGKLEKVSFTGSGCSICMASASMMTQKIKEKSRAEADALLHDFQGMITGNVPEPAPKSLGDLRLLAGVRKFPQRVKCATLAWHALKQALHAKKAAGPEEGLDLNQRVSLSPGDPDL